MKYYIKLEDESLSLSRPHYVKTIVLGITGVSVAYTQNLKEALSGEYVKVLSLISFLVLEFGKNKYTPIKEAK